MPVPHNIADFLRAFRFPVFLISGKARHGGGTLRLLYAGSSSLRAYLASLAFSGEPDSVFMGKQTYFGLIRTARKTRADLEFIRSHTLLGSGPLFTDRLFIPDWISGESNLAEQAAYEDASKSRQRDRKLLARNSIDYSITTDPLELNYFYEEMYVPHVTASHGDAALFMSRDKMHQYVQDSMGELLVIRLLGEAVAGSFLVYENDTPRLFSGGVLNRDRRLMRKGVGVAIYLLSYDYLRSNGHEAVNMGRTRPFLSDGALYFKQRLGLTVSSVSKTGLLLNAYARTPAAARFLENNGVIHLRTGSLRAAFMEPVHDSDGARETDNQRQLAKSIGISEFDELHRADDFS